MNLKCFIESCDYTPVFFCECSGNLQLMCQSHYSIHLNTKQSVMHNLNPVFKKLNAESQVEIIKYIKDMLKSNEQIKTKLRQNTESLLKTVDHLTKCINNINSCLKSNLNQIIKYRRIFNSSIFVCTQSSELSELYQGSYKDIKILVKETIDRYKICDLEDSFNYYTKKQIYLIKDVLFMGLENLDAEELFYFRQNSKNLYKFTPHNESFNIRNIDSIQVQGNLASICKVDKEKLFVYGGYSSNYMATAYLINTTNNQVETLQSSISSSTCSCQLFNNKVYIFGGYYNRNPTSDSRYFDLRLSVWVYLSQLPVCTANVSTLLMNYSILIAGYQNVFYSFNPIENCFNEEAESIEIGYANIFIENLQKVFLLVGKLVYERQQSANGTVWTKFNTSIALESTTSKPCYYKQYAYFVSHNMLIYKFNCENKALRIINN